MHEGPITYDCIIACDWCKAYNPKGTRNYFCHCTGCPDLEPDPIRRRAAYIRKLRYAIQDGSAERVDFAALKTSDISELRKREAPVIDAHVCQGAKIKGWIRKYPAVLCSSCHDGTDLSLPEEAIDAHNEELRNPPEKPFGIITSPNL